jgi:hypothetical protein
MPRSADRVRLFLEKSVNRYGTDPSSQRVFHSLALEKTQNHQNESGTEGGSADPARQGTLFFKGRLEVAELERVFPVGERRWPDDEPQPNQDEHRSNDGETTHADFQSCLRVGAKPTRSRRAPGVYRPAGHDSRQRAFALMMSSLQ